MVARRDKIFKVNAKGAGVRAGGSEAPAEANDRTALPFQAVNVEQTAGGKTRSPNDRPSHGENKGSRSHGNAIHHCALMLEVYLYIYIKAALIRKKIKEVDVQTVFAQASVLFFFKKRKKDKQQEVPLFTSL